MARRKTLLTLLVACLAAFAAALCCALCAQQTHAVAVCLLVKKRKRK